MHQPGGVERAQMAAQLIDHSAAEGFVSAAPDQHAGVILVPLKQRVHAVCQPGQVFHAIPRKGVGHGTPPLHDRFPYAVGFQVDLVDYIQAQLVAQGVKGALVGIVAGAHGIDVVALHGDKIPADGLLAHGTARLGAEIMPVYTLKNDSLPVEAHHAAFHFKAAEAHTLMHNLHHAALCV